MPIKDFRRKVITQKESSQVAENLWIDFVNNYNPDKRSKLKKLYNSLVDYIKRKAGSYEEIDSRDELITGIESRV